MKNAWKKTTAFIMALALVAGFAPANTGGFLARNTAIVASAADESEEPAEIENVTYEGVTYYNVNSQHSESKRLLMMDYLNTPSEELNGYSMADLWSLLGAGLYPGSSKDSLALVDNAIKDSSHKAEGKVDGFYTGVIIGDLEWVGSESDGYLQREIEVPSGDTLIGNRSIYIRFKNPRVVALLPDHNGKNYVTTETSTSTPEETIFPETNSKSVNDTGVEVSYSQETATKKSFSISHTTNTKFGVELGLAVEIGVKGKACFAEVQQKTEFSMKSSFEHGWSSTEAESTSFDEKHSVDVTLPPYTAAMMSRNTETTTYETRYNCPVALQYDVEITRYKDAYTQMLDPNHLYYNFGDSAADARADLAKRVYEGKNGASDKESISWTSGTLLGNDYVKNAIDLINTHAPMTTSGATIVESRTTISTKVTDLLPTRSLSYVKLKDADSSVTMSPGETKSADSFTVAGYNDKNGLYYGFDQSYGKWVVTDANGIAISESASPIKVQKNAVSGETTFTAVKQGKCYLTYFIDENCYASMNGITTYTKNSALSSTAMVEITVEQPEETVYSKKVGDYIVEVHGSYTGIINAAKDNIEGDDKFDVYFLDEEGTEVEPPEYYWKAKELPKRGITLDKNGDAQFTKTGTFHVQLRGEDGTIYSDWIPITVEDRGYEDEDLEIPDVAFVDADADTAFEITGSYTGLVGAEPDSISGMSYGVIMTDDDGNEHKGHSRLDVAAYDKTGAEINVPLTWEAQETDGITMIEDGKVSFTKPGTYHVRAKSGEYFSDWYEITAAEKSEEYSSIAFVNPDGKPLDVFTQTWGSEIKAPADPTMKGYIFKGWSPEIPKTMPADPLTISAQWEIDESVERVLVKANTEGMGNILNGEDYGDEPEFDYENPMQSFNANVIKGDSVILFANADEGWEFAEWRDNATGKTYSTDATITITADAPLDLVAVFKEIGVVENVASDEELLNWAKVDYEKKSGVAVYPEYVSQSDDAYVIAVKDKDGNVLDTYTINPKTGVGSNTASAEVNLPQTGMSGVHKAITGLAAFLTLTGVALVKKSRKEDED